MHSAILTLHDFDTTCEYRVTYLDGSKFRKLFAFNRYIYI